MAFNLATQIANDLDDFDGLETVEYYTRRNKSDNSADDTHYGNISALPREVSNLDLETSEVDLRGIGRVWHIKKSRLDDLGVTPQQGDEIRQCDKNNTKWAILSFDLQTWGTRYRFVCTKGES